MDLPTLFVAALGLDLFGRLGRTVYVLIRSEDYECDEIMGIYDSVQKADAAFKKYVEDNPYQHRNRLTLEHVQTFIENGVVRVGNSHYSINEFELNDNIF